MSDQSASGNRWEPTAAEQAARTASGPDYPIDHDTVPATGDAAPAGAGHGSRPRSRRSRSAARAAGIAAAVLLAGGAGGFALGHQLSADQPATSVDGRGPDGVQPQGPPPNLQPRDDADESGTSGSTTSGSDDT